MESPAIKLQSRDRAIPLLPHTRFRCVDSRRVSIHDAVLETGVSYTIT